MEIKLKGWSSKGFRCPDVDINLSDGNEAFDISFIQMPNGTGKTTTLLLLKACLSGDISNWNSDDIYQLKKKNHPITEGKFTTNLFVNNEVLSIELVADFREKKISFWTISPQSGGRQKGWVIPNQLARFLNEEFIKLFIFDGELADKLLDNEYDEASKAIDALFQLYLLDEIKSRLSEYWDEKTKDVPRKSQQAITLQKNKLKELNEIKEQLENKYKNAQKRVSKNESRIEEIKEEVNSRIAEVEEFREEYNEALAKLEKTKGKITNKSQSAFQSLRNPASIHKNITDALIQSKDNLDNLKLPANTSKQFFEELAEEDDCVCGRPIGEDERKEIINKSEYYLSNDIAGYLNAFKTEVSALQSASFNQEALESELESLSELLDERDRLEGRMRHIQNKLKDRGDEKLKKLESEQVKLEQENENLEKLIRKFESDTETNPLKTKNLSIIDDEIKRIDKEIQIISGKVVLKNKIDLLQDILNQVKLLSKEELKIKILDKFRDRVVNTLEHNPLLVESIDGAIKLENQQSGASVGQTLSIAYCFLTTLLQWGTHSFPLVVDSPAGPLDLAVRRQVAKIIPKLTDQFVAFTISSERQGFVDDIKAHSDKSIRSLTVLRKSEYSNKLVEELKPNIVHNSTDGYVIDDEKFFNQIDIEEEQ